VANVTLCYDKCHFKDLSEAGEAMISTAAGHLMLRLLSRYPAVLFKRSQSSRSPELHSENTNCWSKAQKVLGRPLDITAAFVYN
jgi:hypothetical protein